MENGARARRGAKHGYTWWPLVDRFVRIRLVGRTYSDFEVDISDGIDWPTTVRNCPYILYSWMDTRKYLLASDYFLGAKVNGIPLCTTLRMNAAGELRNPEWSTPVPVQERREIP